MPTKTTTPTIKIEVSRGSCFPRRVTAALGGLQGVGNTFAAASKRLAELVKAKVEHQEERALVICKDGTLLVGATESSGFSYAMTGPDRDTSWTCGCGRGYQNMVDAMIRHAESCYDGVVAVKRV